MRISLCDVIPLTASYVRPNPGGVAATPSNRNCVWLRITLEDGRTGWGEAYSGCYATEVTVAALLRLTRGLVGKRFDDPHAMAEDVRYRNRYWAMRGIGAQAGSAVEGALFDLWSQDRQEPLWSVLDRCVGSAAVPYASAGEVHLSPDEILREARHYSSLGYMAYKMRCGGKGEDSPTHERMALDRDRVAAARQALGPDALLFVDVAVPQRRHVWTLEFTRQYLQTLSPFRVAFIEEPAMTYDIDRYAELERLGLIRTAGGESFSCPEEFTPFFASKALGVAQPDASVVGGPVSAGAVCRAARLNNVLTCLHCWSAGIGIAHNLHTAWGAGDTLAIEWPQAQHEPANAPLASLLRFQDGRLIPSDTPGLGVEIDDSLLEKCRYVAGNERNF